jgi:hypothetical protein
MAARRLPRSSGAIRTWAADTEIVPKSRLPLWKARLVFTDSAIREFRRLASEVQQAFLNVFPIFSRHPWRATAELDVAPLRDTPSRGRLKVEGGHRAIYRMAHGLPELEMVETRAEVYERLRHYLASKW